MQLVSIIVPVYNAESTLKRCVESIISQTYSDWELILVNDGSIDSTLNICKLYSEIDYRIRYLNKENGGPSSARNCGLDNANGRWVTFCDSDDYVEPQWIEQFMLNTSDVSMVSQGLISRGSNTFKVTSLKYDGNVREGILKLYKYPIPGSLCTKCLDKEIIDRYHIRFNEQLRFREDEEFLLRYLLNIKSFRAIEYCGYNYVIPDFNIKYKEIDSFRPFLAIYKTLNEIFTETECYIIDTYIKELVYSVCHAYETDNIYKQQYLYELIESVGKKLIKQKDLSSASRFVIGIIRPKRLTHFIMSWVYGIRKVFKTI